MFCLCQLEKKDDGFTASASFLIVLLDGPEVWQPWKSNPSFLFRPRTVYLIATGMESQVQVSAQRGLSEAGKDSICKAEAAGRECGELHICGASRATARGRNTPGKQKYLIPGGCFHPKGCTLLGGKNRQGKDTCKTAQPVAA